MSRGLPLPQAGETEDAELRQPRDVLYLTAEDGLGDTLRPRLDRLAADVERVHVLRGALTGDARTPVTLADLDVLAEAVRRVRPVLLVVDPIQGYLGAKVDAHRANEVRPLLTGLAQLADEHRCAAVVVRHLAKASAGRALYRGLGSIDFAAAARSVLMAGEAPQKGERALVHIKSSCAPSGPSQGYSLDAGAFKWTGSSEVTAADLIAPERVGGERGTKLAAAEAFVREVLADGPMPSTELERRASTRGITRITLRRACDAVRVARAPRDGQWWAELPAVAGEQASLGDW